MSTLLFRPVHPAAVALFALAAMNPDWPHYGGGPDQTRYSTLTQITPANVNDLRVAWTYDTHDAFDGSEMQCQPVVAHGVLYATSPKLRVFALNAATGEQIWSFDPNDAPRTGRTRIRGLMYFERRDDRRIYFAAQHWLYALDAKTGKKIEKFGNGGRIDLRRGFEGRDPGTLSIGVNTPGVFYRNLLILGSIVPESLPSAPGDIRAFDVDSGKEVWSFHTIPHPGEFGYDTWPPDAWKYSGGVNAWAGISLDEKRGYVYASTGSASYDFYGANRVGDDLFANTVLCLRADTGQRVWHFQAVKHDLLDRDFPAPPSLITIQHDGRSIDVVSQTAKNGRVYVLDRDTGTPVFPMQEVHPPASDLPGEQSAPTQVLPTLPPPFTRQRFTEDLITKRTPEAETAVREQWGKLRNRGEFDPPSLQGTILFPGMDGGGEWGGTAFDPTSGLLYVNANEMAWRVRVVERKMPDGEPTSGKELYERYCASCHRADMKGTPPEFPSLVDIGARRSVDDVAHVVQYGAGRMPGHPELHGVMRRAIVNYVLTGTSDVVRADQPTPFDLRYTLDGYIRFTDPQGFPAVTPPWGTLTAIDMNHASIAWQVPLGEVPGSGMTNTGSENYGGPVVTASGLLFIGATNYDKKFRAFDAHTGKVLWETTLPAAGNATPAVYEVNGREYVVIAAGGGKGAPSGGTYVAFSLPATAAVERARPDRIQIIRHDDDRRVDVAIDGKPFTSYIYPATHVTKPVLYPLRSARGTIVTRGFPLEPRPGESKDHPHQVGAWFTYGDVNGIDFWGYSDETPAAQVAKKGTIRQRSIASAVSGTDRGELAVTADWVMPDGSTIMGEETRFILRGDSDSRVVDRITRWTARDTRVVFKDTKEGAFGIRVAKSLEQPTGQYHSSEGTAGDAVWGTRARWMALTGAVDGENVVLAICDHPSNPGYPTYWHARGYGLFAANPFGVADFTKGKERLNFTLDPGRSVEFHYRILILSGTPSLEAVASSCSQFTAGFPAVR